MFKKLAILALCLTLATPVYAGNASWYGPGFHGRKTASGEVYNQNSLTCAHKSFKFGTLLRVTNKKNGKSIVCRVNDRGPYSRGRAIDLSKKGAQIIGMIHSGVANVIIQEVGSINKGKKRKKK